MPGSVPGDLDVSYNFCPQGAHNHIFVWREFLFDKSGASDPS